MRVILQSDIKGIGRRNEVKDVSDGYARNYLFPRALAVLADETGIKRLASARRQSDEEMQKLRGIARKIEKEELLFILPAGAKGTPFGGVNKAMIMEKLRARGAFPVGLRAEVRLLKPIKESGDHRVEVQFPRGIVFSVRVTVQSPR